MDIVYNQKEKEFMRAETYEENQIMRSTWFKRIRTAAVICAAAGVVFSAIGHARAVELAGSCSLTVSYEEKEEFYDLKEIADDLVVDLYQVATAVKDAHNDTYTYSVNPGFSFKNAEEKEYDLATVAGLGELKTSDWELMAQQAGETVLAEGSEFEHVEGKLDEKFEKLDGGLYLVVVHADGDTDYVTREKDEEGNEYIASQATALEYVYTFKPQLISLPSVEKKEGEALITGGEWLYDVSMNLKVGQKPRYGDLRIEKILDSYDTSSKKVTFVFNITAEKNGKRVFADVEELTFSSAGNDVVEIIGKIPVGSEIKVTEVYSGSAYKLVTDKSEDGVIKIMPIPEKPEDSSEVTYKFQNTYSGDTRQGHGLKNHFEWKDGKWQLNNGTGEGEGKEE